MMPLVINQVEKISEKKGVIALKYCEIKIEITLPQLDMIQEDDEEYELDESEYETRDDEDEVSSSSSEEYKYEF